MPRWAFTSTFENSSFAGLMIVWWQIKCMTKHFALSPNYKWTIIFNWLCFSMMIIYLTSYDIIEICLLKPTHDFSFRSFTQNWTGVITNALKHFAEPLRAYVDNGKQLAAVSWTVTEIKWSSAWVDFNVQLGTPGFKSGWWRCHD